MKRAALLGLAGGIAVLLALAASVVAQRGSRAPVAHSSLGQPPGGSGCFVQADADGGSCATGHALLGADAVVVSPDGRHVYVASRGADHLLERGSNGVAIFARSARDGGRLRQLGCVTQDATDGREGTDGICADGHALAKANGIDISPDGRHVYVAAAGSGLAAFSRNPRSGALRQTGCHVDAPAQTRCSDAAALGAPTAVAVSPDGEHVYVTSRGSHAVGTFARDAESGSLTQVGCVSGSGSDGACTNGTALGNPSAVAVSPDGRNVYVTTAKPFNGLLTFAREPATGLLTQLGCVQATPPPGGTCADGRGLGDATGVVVSPDGRHVYVSAIDSSAINTFVRRADGSVEQRQCIAEFSEERGCRVGQLLAFATAVAITSDGRSVLVTDAAGSGLSVYSRNGRSGRLRLRSCIVEAEAFEPDEEEDAAVPCSPGRGLFGAKGLALSPDDENAYVASDTGSALGIFTQVATVASRSARVDRRGTALVTVACPGARRQPCGGRLGVARRSRPGAAGSMAGAAMRFRVRPGRTAAVRLLVPARLSRALDRRGRARARIILVQKGGASTASPLLLRRSALPR